MSLKIKRDYIFLNGSVISGILLSCMGSVQAIAYIDKLNKIQRAAVHFVTINYQRKSSVTALIKDLDWTSLQTRRKNFRLTILNGLIAVGLHTFHSVSDLLTPADERTRGGRNKSFKHNYLELTPR